MVLTVKQLWCNCILAGKWFYCIRKWMSRDQWAVSADGLQFADCNVEADLRFMTTVGDCTAQQFCGSDEPCHSQSHSTFCTYKFSLHSHVWKSFMGAGNIVWDYCVVITCFIAVLMALKYISPLSRRNNSIPFCQRIDRKGICTLPLLKAMWYLTQSKEMIAIIATKLPLMFSDDIAFKIWQMCFLLTCTLLLSTASFRAQNTLVETKLIWLLPSKERGISI